jgi:hypothetical protein
MAPINIHDDDLLRKKDCVRKFQTSWATNKFPNAADVQLIIKDSSSPALSIQT